VKICSEEIVKLQLPATVSTEGSPG